MSTRKTNAEVAAKYGISDRTVSRMRGRSRTAYLAECHEIRRKAASLRSTGMTWAQVGAALGMTERAAQAAGKRAIGAWATGAAAPEVDTQTGDLFA